MEQRKLGRQGLVVPAMGLGCMGMSFAYGKADQIESRRTLERSLDLGMNFWDTAEIYGPFENEELIGSVLRGRRNKIILATKFAWQFSPDGTRLGLDGTRKNMRRALEGSLKRLRTDYVDLFYLHRLDPQTPVEETVAGMAELVKEGKVRFIGLSEVGPLTLRKAHAVYPISALQSEYSLWWQERIEQDILPVLRELGIGLVAYSPVGRGFLTGSISTFDAMPEDDFRRTFPRFQEKNLKTNLEFVRAVQNFALTKKMTAAQVCLAWLLHQGPDIVPIPGTTRVDHLEEDAKAAVFSLSKKDHETLERIVSTYKITGERLPDNMMRMVMVP